MNLKVVLGVTGSIAAYKACELVRLFIKRGDEVRVVMTSHACSFVTPLTFATLSHNPVSFDLFAQPQNWNIEHIHLAEWASCVVVAPATANILAKMAHGLADDLLSSVLLATRAPLFVAPAMNTGMWAHPATQANLATLKQRGVHVIEPASGALACGSLGAGRLAEPEEILSSLIHALEKGTPS